MNYDIDELKKQQRAMIIVIAYPFGILVVAGIMITVIVGVNPVVVAIPSLEFVRATAIAGVLLIINHTWLMTATEITRSRYRIFSTPEEWRASGLNPEDISKEGTYELKRHHDTHLNSTENTIYYIFLCLPFAFVSPPVLAAGVNYWIRCIKIGVYI